MAQDLIDKIRAQAQARGLDPEIAVRIAQVESSLDPSAKAKTSSAQGLFQVVDKTWKDFGGKPGQKNNPDENIRVGLNILESNTKSLRSALGRDPSPTELYAAHFLGAQGAKTVLAANPDTPVSELLSPRAIKANPTLLKDKSAQELMAALDAKMGMQGSRPTAQAAPVQAPMPAPTAGAPKRAAAPATAPVKQAAVTGDLGAGYQAALALSFLGEDEDEDKPLSREEWQARTDEKSAADMMAEYKPKNALAQIDWDESSLLTRMQPQQPQRMADGGEVKEPSLIAVPGYSEMVARDMYPAQQGQFDQQDAARHMLASGTLARKYGPGTAEFLGNAHEIVTSPLRWVGSKLGISQMPVDYEQDLHNNRLGIELARRSKSQKELEDLVQAEAERAAREQRPGSAWIGRPVKRAEGSPATGEVAEPTPEELAAASRPAFVTPKSGIGRNITMTPGQVNDAVVQGISETPYNLLGAPVDVATMVMRPFGYTNPTPTMGSDWIKQQMTRLGVRPEAPTQPTARALYEMGQFGGAMVNPAAPVRAAAAAVERAAPVVQQAVAAAAPVARSTAAQMLEKAQNVPVGMSIKPVEPIFRATPTADAPFVSRLDDFVATMQSPVRKDQFLGQLRGKFREYDINRAEEVLADLPANAKLTPSDLLNRLKSRYDPANMRTTVIEPKEKAYFAASDNRYWDRPVGVIHLSSFAEPALLERVSKAESLNSEFSYLRSLEYSPPKGFAKLEQLVHKDPLAKAELDRVLALREQTKQHLSPLIEGYRLMQSYDYPALAPNYDRRMAELREAARAVEGPLYNYAKVMETAKDSIRREVAQTLTQQYGRVPKDRSDLQYLIAMKMGDQYNEWAKQGEILEQGTKKAADDLRTLLLSDPQRFGVESPYKGKGIHGSLEPPPNAVAFTRFVEQTSQDPQRGPLKGIHLLEVQSDLTSELKKGKGPKDKEVFPNMAENRRTVQQLGMKNAISAAINRGDQFVTFPGQESAKPKLYESLRDNLKQVAKDLGPGFEIRPFTFKDAEGKELQHWGITWGPEAAQRVQKQGVPFKDGGLVERRPDDSRKYL